MSNLFKISIIICLLFVVFPQMMGKLIASLFDGFFSTIKNTADGVVDSITEPNENDISNESLISSMLQSTNYYNMHHFPLGFDGIPLHSPLLSNNQINQFTDDIYYSIGILNDNENKINTTLKKITTLTDSYRMSRDFYNKFGVQILPYIDENQSLEESAKSMRIIKNSIKY